MSALEQIVLHWSPTYNRAEIDYGGLRPLSATRTGRVLYLCTLETAHPWARITARRHRCKRTDLDPYLISPRYSLFAFAAGDFARAGGFLVSTVQIHPEFIVRTDFSLRADDIRESLRSKFNVAS